MKKPLDSDIDAFMTRGTHVLKMISREVYGAKDEELIDTFESMADTFHKREALAMHANSKRKADLIMKNALDDIEGFAASIGIDV